MTKQEIKDNLLLMKGYSDGKSKNELRQSDDICDYHYGKSEAYKDMAERIELLIDKMG
jgi:hypothetical protein